MREFVRAGFVRLPTLLSAEGVARARGAVERVLAAPAGAACERPNNTLVALRWDDDLVGLALAAHERIAGAIGARDLRWISGYVSVKGPHSPPLWWHQDWWAWDHPVSFRREAAQVAVLCYLSDTTTTTGALRVLPETHRASVALHAALPEAHSDESTALDLDHPAMADHPDEISLDLRAGDAVVTDYRLLHGTHANAADHRRDCLLMSFTPDWHGLPDDVRAHLVRHPAQRRPDELPPRGVLSRLLPRFDGEPRDLLLNRNAPAVFATE